MLLSTLTICLDKLKMKVQPCGACISFLRLRLVLFMIAQKKLSLIRLWLSVTINFVHLPRHPKTENWIWCRFFLRLRHVVFMIEYDKVGFSISFPSVLCVRKSRLQRSLGQQFYCASYFCLSIHISECSSKVIIMTEWLCLECINTSIIWGGSHFMES